MSDDIEALAIECARGNNGGEWATHYTDEQKEFWRSFVRKMQLAARSAALEEAAKVADAWARHSDKIESRQVSGVSTHYCERIAAAIRELKDK